MSLAKVFCSWSIAAVLLLLSITFSNSAESEKSLDPAVKAVDENGEEANTTSKSKSNVTLTGNPQIDYIHDPNLPRELNGYNLSDYPFYSRVPKNINFSCDGRKEGFYASIEHKCQIYHHCLFGSRFDFICANYTAFDQRTFICQFVSDVDCPNSHMFYHRNKDLYVTKSTTTQAPLNLNRDIYERRRPPKKPKPRPRPADDAVSTGKDAEQPSDQGTVAPDTAAPSRKTKDEYADDDYDEADYDYYPARRPSRPIARRRNRKCRIARRRGRRCRVRRPLRDYYYEDDYADDEDYDEAYESYDEDRPKKYGKRTRPWNAIPAGTSQVTSTSSSETPPPTSSSSTTTSTTTTTTERQPPTSSESTGPLDSESITVLQNKRDELFTKTRRPGPVVRPSRLSDKLRPPPTTTTERTTTTTTTTERAKPSTTTTTTTEAPQYIYDYEYYEDDTPAETPSTTTTTTTVKPYFRGKVRGGNSAAALLEKQRVQQSIQVRITEDSGTNTNTIRRRDNSNVQTPTRVATPPSTTPISTTTTTTTSLPPTPPRPARFWQRKSTVKSISTTLAPSTTSTTSAPYYQEYQDYEDVEVADPLPSMRPQTAAPQQSSKFQPVLNPQLQQYGTSPANSQRQSYASTGPSAPPPQPMTTSRGHSLSSSSYARPNKPYSMQQYSQSSSSSSSSISSNNNNNNNNNNYNSNSYHRERSPPAPVVPKPEFISLVDEDYNNPYVSPVAVSPTSATATRLHGGGGGGGGGQQGYHQHPIRYFEQQHHNHNPFLFGAASEYNNPQFAFPPRNYPSPSNFQPYGHSTRRFSAHMFK